MEPVVVVDQGLAGTLLAWELVKRGRRVLVVDEGSAVTSSKIAAGIVTPISGKRLTVSFKVGVFLPEASGRKLEKWKMENWNGGPSKVRGGRPLDPEVCPLRREDAGFYEWMDVLRERASAAVEPVVVVGQGLAGTLLAWELVKRGRRVLVVDEGAAVTSSKIAAGIVTPISGKRLTVSPEVGVFLPEAWDCYAASAKVLGRAHFHRLPQVRLFRNAEEPALLAAKRGRPEFAAHLGLADRDRDRGVDGHRWVEAAAFHGDGTGFEMTTSGWLDTRAWLADSAAWFAEHGMLRTMALDPGSVVPEADGVRLPDGTRAAAVVFCEGHSARRNPWFPWVKWKCAKGEILTLRIPELAAERRIIHRGSWLLPVDGDRGGGHGGGTFRTGSTYEWKTLDTEPTLEGRAVLEGRLRELLRVPWEVTGREAAVRPIIHQSLARMGRHPVHPALVFFNGLGSKGVLHGPRYARMLAEHLVDGRPLPLEVDVVGN